MVRLRAYACVSLIATIAVICHAFKSRGQFYPAMVYLSTSKICLVLLLNMGLVIMCVLWQLTKKVFLGSLREAEVERLDEQSWREVMEILFAITIFRQDFSVTFLAMVTALLLIKALHWLAQKRMEYMETTPRAPTMSHVRIVSFMGFLLLLDGLFLYSSVKHLVETRKASVSIFFAFEYMILATTTVSIFVKYVFFVSDMLMEGQWEKKPVFTFYLELIRDLLHLSMYLCFFLVIFVNYGVPLHLIRELYETFRNFKIRVADYIRYRKITSNMNDRFPDATPGELNASDATCIICREEMIIAKKLICGHLFHVHCLRSWLERQHTCPTCRALVVPPEAGTSAAGGQQGSQAEAHSHGTGSGITVQGASSDGTTGNNVSQHEARLQAAATAAAMYKNSCVYPSANSLVWSQGYAEYPQIQRPMSDTPNGQAEQFAPLEPTNFSFPPMGHCVFVPSQVPGANNSNSQSLRDNSGLSDPQLEAQRRFIQHQIEVLQNQLQLLPKPKMERNVDEECASSSDNKGKNVVSSSSLMSHSGEKAAEDITGQTSLKDLCQAASC